jgi:hypothetical protein
MKTAFVAAAFFAMSTFGAVQAQAAEANEGELYQVVVTASKSQVTREQKRQEAINALRSGVVNSGEGYQNQLPVAGKSAVTRDAVRAQARAANRSNVVTGGELYQ